MRLIAPIVYHVMRFLKSEANLDGASHALYGFLRRVILTEMYGTEYAVIVNINLRVRNFMSNYQKELKNFNLFSWVGVAY